MTIRRVLVMVGLAAAVSAGGVVGWALVRSDAVGDEPSFTSISSKPSLGNQRPAVMVTGTVEQQTTQRGDVGAVTPYVEVASLKVASVVFDRTGVYPGDSYLRDTDVAPSVGDWVQVAVASGTVPATALGVELVAWLTPTIGDSPRWTAIVGLLDREGVTFVGDDVGVRNAQLEYAASVFGVSEFEAMRVLGLQLLDRNLDSDQRATEGTEYVDAVRDMPRDFATESGLDLWLATDPAKRGLQRDSTPSEVWKDVVSTRALFRIDLDPSRYPGNAIVLVRSPSGISAAVSVGVEETDETLAGMADEALEVVLANTGDFDGEVLATIDFSTWSTAPSLVLDITDESGAPAVTWIVAEDRRFTTDPSP